MTRDYAKPKRRGKSNAKRTAHGRGSAPGWLWLLAGVLIGVLTATLVRLDNTPLPGERQTGETAKKDRKPENDGGPRFDFYTLLKETEVIVPEESPKKAPPEPVDRQSAPASSPSQRQSDGNVYILQAGSFKSAEDADSLRARLLLLNMDASIQAVALRPGETWHRVLVGPFTSTARLSEARSTLMQNGIDTIQLKRK